MSTTTKTYLDLDGLKKYDTKIKEWTGTQITSAVNALDYTEAPIAVENSSTHVITIHGIKEENGVIAVGNTAANDVTLAAVASTGKAEDVTIDDTGSHFTATDVEGALAELAEAAGGGVASKTVYITETAGGSGDAYSKRYGVYQGADGTVLEPVAGEHLVDIDIPKDMVVSAGIVVEVEFVEGTGGAADKLMAPIGVSGADVDVTEEILGTGVTPTEADAGQYIMLTIANAASSHLWIKASTLVDIYTSGSQASDEIVVTINNETNTITAAIGTNGIPASKVIHSVAAVYTQLTEEDEYDSTETYYTKSGSTYTEDDTVNSENFATKVAAGLYIKESDATTETVQEALDKIVASTPDEVITDSEIDDLFD